MLNIAFRGVFSAVAGIGFLLASWGVQADFLLGFENEAVDPILTIDCNRGGEESRCAFGGSDSAYFDPTPFLQEVVVIDGIRYYHVAIGDPASDFAQETYIQASDCCFQASTHYDPFPKSASNGAGGSANGSGSANPNRVVMSNMVRDAEMTQLFLKDSLQFKPVITQSVVNDDVRMDFQIDMSALDYGTLDTPGIVSNQLSLLRDNFEDKGDYDNAIVPTFFSDEAKVNQTVSGGRYIYTTGPDRGGSGGVYTHWDGGGYEEYLADHNLFRRDEQNVGFQIRR